MAVSKQMRKLAKKWQSNTGWPQRIEWMELTGLRGWTGQRVTFGFPLMAITGENGVGKSTILQAVASVYRSPEQSNDPSYFASKFFPDTPWEKIQNATVKYSVREGLESLVGTLQKPTNRWRETPDRRRRVVRFVDLRRMQPIVAQTGYWRIAKTASAESQSDLFDPTRLLRYSAILGRRYDEAGFALSDVDEKRWVPVISTGNDKYSGFHQGAGEAALADLLRRDFPKYSIVLIDEVETSLHPRAQRRLVRDLADLCRTLELQVFITTHSPSILEELPEEGRIQIINSAGTRTLVTGISPFFAMSQMDDEPHPEADVFVEDEVAQILVKEIIVAERKELARRCCLVPYGAASVGRALGQMVAENRFPRPSIVFLDADQSTSVGCLLLPGDDAPECVVFQQLKEYNWKDVPERIGRDVSDVIDALGSAMTNTDHHEWVKSAADRLFVGGNDLWRALASAWAVNCARAEQRLRIVDAIQDAIDGLKGMSVEVQADRQITAESAAEADEPAPLPESQQAAETLPGQRKLF
jgi:predicted ATPase